jgi:hypothetical protein
MGPFSCSTQHSLVFSIYAKTIPGGDNVVQVSIALGA